MRINPRCDLLIGNRPENDSDNQYLECEDCHRYEICKKHGCVEMCSPEEIKVAIPIVLEPSYDLLTKEGYFEMSMISEQVKHLKELSDTARANVYSFEALSQSLREAANTIESLSAKLQAANMERSAECGGWIPVEERLPEYEECNVLCDIFDEEENRHIIKIMKYVDLGNCEYEFLNSFRVPQNVIAWQPLPEPYHEP